MLSTTLALASLATLSTVSAFQPHHHNAIKRSPPSHSHHWSRSQLPGTASRAARFARRGNSDEPSTLSEGSLTAAEGCTQWFHVGAGDSCYSALATVSPYPGLEAFYEMNPQVNSDCFNLWAGFDYCVARTTSSSSSAPSASSSAASTSTKAVAAAVVRVASTSSPSPSPTTTTTTSAPTATVAAASADDEEEDCEVDDEEEEYTSTSAAPVVKAAAAQTTTAAPATPTDDSAAQAAASKSSADAAWASSSKSSADAAWASSSKAAADAAWASSSKAAAAAATTSEAAAPETTKVADVSGSGSQSTLRAAGISTLLGENTNGIASWFRTNNAQDSTNGNSWCYRPYDDSKPGFAPSLKAMVASFGGDPIAAGKAFCGLRAEFVTPDGKTTTLTLMDAFDDTWVLTPASVDVIQPAFAEMFGRWTDNKSDVIQGVSWKFTGERDPDYVFNNGNPV